MTPLYDYIMLGILPDDTVEAKNIKIKAPYFMISDSNLYNKGYLTPWMKCIKDDEGEEVLKQTHVGEVGAHEGAMALTGRVLRMGLY